MAIELLPRIDEVTAGAAFAVNVSGQDYRVSASDVLAFIQAGISVDQLATQYAAPLTGTTVQVGDGGKWLILTPAGTLAALTVKLPLVASAQDKQELLVNSTQIVTTLTVDGNGASVVGAPSTLAANGFFRLRYDAVMQTWYRVG